MSPYRSNAYLGFLTPEYTVPNHFHLPKGSNKFVPIRRSKSLTEVFSNEKYSKLLDNSPLILPYAGKTVPPKRIQKKLFSDNDDFENPFNHMTQIDLDIQYPLSHCNNDLLKEVDDKIDRNRTQRGSETFIKRISDYNIDSTFNTEENNNNNFCVLNLNMTPKSKGRKTFEHLDTLEQAIILELERGKLDRSKGSIFQKIEQEIKNKNKMEEKLKQQSSFDLDVHNIPNYAEIQKQTNSTPYVSKIPVLRPSTVPKINATKSKLSIQRSKTKTNFITPYTRIQKSKQQKQNTPIFQKTSCSKTNHSAIFGKNPFNTEDSNKGAFKIKDLSNASSMWVPIDKKASQSDNNYTFGDFVKHQSTSMKDLGHYQNRMKNDMNEILSIHKDIEKTIGGGSKTKTLNKNKK